MAFLAAPFDPFQALGLERDATLESIRSRYYQLARFYHPNSNQASEESKHDLSEYFVHVRQAWELLNNPARRQRYIELLNLYDQNETIQAAAADLLQGLTGSPENAGHRRNSTADGYVSSDADDNDDEDIPHISTTPKRKSLDRARGRGSALADIAEGSESNLSSERQPQERVSQLRVDSGRNSDADRNDAQSSAQRRKRVDRLRRKELEAYNDYRDAVIAKLEAEQNVERCKELYEIASWRRHYLERAPKDTGDRLRFIKLITKVAKFFVPQQEPVRRRKDSSASAGGQILSTGDPFRSTNPYLTLPSRGKSIRRPGFSSDISIDQTSSEDEYASDKASSPKRNARASSPAPDNHHSRHRSGEWMPSALVTVQRRLPNADHDPISPITGPVPRVIIRTATNLHEMQDDTGSDTDKALASSTSISFACHDPPSQKFSIVQPTSMSELFGSATEERGRAGSIHQDLSSANSTMPGHNDNFLFEIKQVGQLRHPSIPIETVHDIRSEEKQTMLSINAVSEADSEKLLHALEKLDTRVADRFMVKPDIMKMFNFRLIYDYPDSGHEKHDTFIALSYRRKLHVETQNNAYSLPLEPEMFQAVWDERLSDAEGVWIDQICIANTEDEKTTSMSAMDMVYRSARLVVVALDDVHLEAHEGQILASHMEDFESLTLVPFSKRYRQKSPPWLDQHRDLYGVVRKLLRSSWFKRAWCRHEMRLANDHIFLVPCRLPGLRQRRNVLRFSSKCLTHLIALATEVAFEPSIEAVKPALYAFFRDRSKSEHHIRSHHGNFTTVVAEVFAMEAGGDPNIPEEQREADARKDKIAIILNTMECGLALRPSVRRSRVNLPLSECNYMLLLLALAARDPGALCSVGHSFSDLPYNLSSTWMLEPTNVDSGLNNYRTLNRLPAAYTFITNADNGEHSINLDFKFVTSTNILRAAQAPGDLALAKQFIEFCDKRKLGRYRKRYLLNDRTANHLFGSMLEVYTETFVCVLAAGPDWMSEVCQRYGVSRWRHDLQPAFDLLIAFKNTAGRWPERAWQPQAVGFLMDFVNFLVIRGLPQRQIMVPQAWRPICVHPPLGGAVLTFIPPGQIQVAIPAALMDSDYLHLARMWILEPRGEVDEDNITQNHEWTLLGKSVLFTDEAAMETIEADNGRIRGGQTVYGRPSTDDG